MRGLFLFAVAVRGDVLRCQQLPKHPTQVANTLATDRVMHPLALFSAGDDPGIAEDLHMVGQRRLADIQFVQQLAGALLAAMEQLQNANTVLIAQSFENRCHILLGTHRCYTSHR